MTEHKPSHTVGEPCVAQPKAKSKGEKLFDRVVYGGIAGVGTFVLTLFMANKFKNGDWAGPRYMRATAKVESALGRVLPETWARKLGAEAIQTTSLMMGGNAMLLPIGLAEKHKTQIVNGLNVMLGDPTPPQAIAQTPQQTWRSLIEGRLLAWGAVFSALVGAGVLLPKTFETYCDEFAKRTHQVVQWAKRKPMASELAMKATTSYRVGSIAALDVFATIAAVVLLYVGGHFFARKQEEKKEKKENRVQHPPIQGDAMPGDSALPEPSRTEVSGEKLHMGRVQAAEMMPSIS